MIDSHLKLFALSILIWGGIFTGFFGPLRLQAQPYNRSPKIIFNKSGKGNFLSSTRHFTVKHEAINFNDQIQTYTFKRGEIYIAVNDSTDNNQALVLYKAEIIDPNSGETLQFVNCNYELILPPKAQVHLLLYFYCNDYALPMPKTITPSGLFITNYCEDDFTGMDQKEHWRRKKKQLSMITKKSSEGISNVSWKSAWKAALIKLIHDSSVQEDIEITNHNLNDALDENGELISKDVVILFSIKSKDEFEYRLLKLNYHVDKDGKNYRVKLSADLGITGSNSMTMKEFYDKHTK